MYKFSNTEISYIIHNIANDVELKKNGVWPDEVPFTNIIQCSDESTFHASVTSAHPIHLVCETPTHKIYVLPRPLHKVEALPKTTRECFVKHLGDARFKHIHLTYGRVCNYILPKWHGKTTKMPYFDFCEKRTIMQSDVLFCKVPLECLHSIGEDFESCMIKAIREVFLEIDYITDKFKEEILALDSCEEVLDMSLYEVIV